MKIYTEIAIDMNPESSSYGETLHEDSFEYKGPMELALWGKQITKINATDGDTYQIRGKKGINTHDYRKMKIFASGGKWKYTTHTNRSKVEAVDFFKGWINRNAGGPVTEAYTSGQFTYTEGDFDPTSEEFRRSVERTGGYGELAEGFGMEESDYDTFYGKPLEFLEEGFSLGKAGVGLKTGQSLFDVKEQMDVAAARTGMATQGGLQAQQQRAQRGIMADYNQQQQQLALDYERNVESFWKSTEEEFYGETDILDEAQSS